MRIDLKYMLSLIYFIFWQVFAVSPRIVEINSKIITSSLDEEKRIMHGNSILSGVAK